MFAMAGSVAHSVTTNSGFFLVFSPVEIVVLLGSAWAVAVTIAMRQRVRRKVVFMMDRR